MPFTLNMLLINRLAAVVPFRFLWIELHTYVVEPFWSGFVGNGNDWAGRIE